MVKMVDIKTATVSNAGNIFTSDEHFRLVRELLGVILNLPCLDPFSASSKGSAQALAHIKLEYRGKITPRNRGCQEEPRYRLGSLDQQYIVADPATDINAAKLRGTNSLRF
jgi:hypothetical protein